MLPDCRLGRTRAGLMEGDQIPILIHGSISSTLSLSATIPRRNLLVCDLQPIRLLVIVITLSSLFLACSACTSFLEKSEINLPPKENLERYIQTADHLTDQQRKKLAQRRPFVGMTLEEANLAMYQESTEPILGGKAFRAVYVGNAGVKYYLYFQGDPPRVAYWSYLSPDEIELIDPDKLGPSPPGFR